MFKKILMLVGLVFLLCGCSANVNINVNEKTINESVLITAFANNKINKEQLKESFREFIPIYADTVIVDTLPDKKEAGIKYYNRTVDELDNGYNFTYKYTFNLNNYVQARTVKKGFKSATAQYDKDKKTITLSTDNSGMLFFEQYPDLEEVKVNITSDYKVLENNADVVNGNIYTWVFTPNSQKGIYILYDTNIDETSNENSENNKKPDTEVDNNKAEKKGIEKFINDHPVLIALCCLALFIIFVIIISKFSKR